MHVQYSSNKMLSINSERRHCNRWDNGLGFLPLSLGILMVVAIVVCYLIAVFDTDVEAFFPYISDTGVSVPERNIFSQFINFASFIAFITMYLRYKLIMGLLSQGYHPRIVVLARINLFLAVCAAAGLSMVANFQETAIEALHLTGAFLVFGLGVVYALIDTAISFLMRPNYQGSCMCWARLAVAILGAISLVITIVAGGVSRSQWANQPKPQGAQRIHWKPDYPGFTAHLVSTFGEWITALSFCLYFFTFIRDFCKLTISVQSEVLVPHLDMEPLPKKSRDPNTVDENTPLLT